MPNLILRTAIVAVLAWLVVNGGKSAIGQQENQRFLTIDGAGHSARAWTCIFVPGDRELITVSEDKTIRVWDVNSGESRRTLRLPIGPGGDGKRYCAGLLKDGNTLLVAGFGMEAENWGTIYAISLSDGSVIRTFTGHSNVVFCLACSSDGERFATGSMDKTVRIWNVKTGLAERVIDGHKGVIYGVDFSPDGQKLLTTSFDHWGAIWDVRSGQQLKTLKHPAEIRCAAWSPDGQTIATGCYDGQIRLWKPDGTLKKTVGNLGQQAKPSSVRFSPDSQRLACTISSPTGPWPVSIIDVPTGTIGTRYNSHENTGMWSEFSGNGRLIASTDFLGEVHLWNAADGAPVRQMKGKGQTIWSVGWNKTGTMIAWGHAFGTNTHKADSPLQRIFDLTRLEYTQSPREVFTKATLINGTLQLSASQETSVDVHFNNAKISTLEMTTDYDKQFHTVRSFTLVPKQRAVVGAEWGLYLYELQTGKRIREFQPSTELTGVNWAVSPSPDGRFFLSGGSDQLVHLWNPERDEPLVSFFFAQNEWIAWTPEGYYAASPNGGRLLGWHINNGLDRAASFVPVSELRETLHRPDVIKLALQKGSVAEAIQLAGAPTAAEIDTLVRAASTEAPTVADAPPPVAPSAPAVVAKPPANAPRTVPTVHATEHLGEDRYALVIGVDDYNDENVPDLSMSERDARAVYEVLTDEAIGGVAPKNATLLLGKDATTRKVKSALNRLRALPKRATAFIYFSGHGMKESGDGYWMTQDAEMNDLAATALSDTELRKFLGDVQAERMLVMIDACYAAATVHGAKDAPKGISDLLSRFTGTGHAILSAAGDGEEALEASELKHSVFTYHLLDALRGRADANKDGVVVLPELTTYLDEHVADEARRRKGIQKPVVDFQGVQEPAKFRVVIDPQRLEGVLKQTQGERELRDKRLATLHQLALDEKITEAQYAEGRSLLIADPSKLTGTDRAVLTEYINVVDGTLAPEKLTKALALARVAADQK